MKSIQWNGYEPVELGKTTSASSSIPAATPRPTPNQT